MLINNYTNKTCRKSWVDNGDCCCNCIYRYLLMVDNFPMGYYCKCKAFDDTPMFISIDGHGMCEMHRRKHEKCPEKLFIE